MDFLNSLKTQLQSITYIDGVYVGDDAYMLMEKGKTFINIEVERQEIEPVEDLSISVINRVKYFILLRMSTRNKSKSIAEFGNGTIKGIWDLINDTWDVIIADRTISGSVTDIDELAQTNQKTYLNNDLYVTQAEMKFSIYQDHFYN